MYRHAASRTIAVAAVAFALVACGGGGSGSGGAGAPSAGASGAPNVAPTANAGAAQQVEGQSTVTLDASASHDADGTIASYAWVQTAGPPVALNSAAAVRATFAAPIVAASTVLSFMVTVTDNVGAAASATVDVTVAPESQVSGHIDFDLVPFNPATSGLDFTQTSAAPVRGAVVEAISTADRSTILATGSTDDAGNYALAFKGGVGFFLRVKAQMLATGTPSWNFRVVDNTSANALYVLDGQDTTNDGGVHNLHAASGWGGTSYTGERSAAPFAILDAIYQAFHLVLGADAALQFPALDVHWSTGNHDSDTFTPATGAVGTYYRSGTDSTAGIYLLGTENVDTDEYDTHVIAHEWGHYFQDKFSRDDSLGGSHTIGDRLDLRVAFSEGWGNAFSGMATADSYYRDSSGLRQASGFAINVESNNIGSVTRGWYSETSNQSIFYDLFDSNSDGVDTLSLGFAPIYAVMTNELRNSDAFTSIFSFVSALKSRIPDAAAQIDAIVSGQLINSGAIDAYGSAETNNGGDARNLPIYRALTVNAGTPINVCSSTANGETNKLGNRRFFTFSMPQSAHVTITAQSAAGKDPDMVLHQKGNATFANSNSTSNGRQQLAKTLSAGNYVLEVYDAKAVDGDTSTAGNACMDVTVTSP